MATIAEAFTIAIQHHQGGRLQAAEHICRQILQIEPNHHDAFHLLGVIAYQAGKHEIAVEYLRRAIELKPDYAETHNNLGSALRGQGKLEEAVDSFRRALQLKPDYAEANNNMGNVLRHQGKLAEAVDCYHRALQLKPNSAETHNNLGIVLRGQGKLEEAVGSFRRALQLRPNYAEAHNNLGNGLREQGKLAEAVDCHRRALQLKPDYAEAHNNMGNGLRDQGKLDEAVGCYHRALQMKPDFADAHYNLGNALQDQGKPEEAIDSFRRALQLKPDYAEPNNNMGNVLRHQRKLAEAIDCYRRALQLKPDYAEAHNNLGMIWLLRGNFEQGWPEYEWRRQCQDFPRVSFSQPLWDGTTLTGKTILLYAEQGLGDTLQFIRYARFVKNKGGTVLLECPVELIKILQNCAGIDQIVPRGYPLPFFDVQAPLLSLPGILGTTPSTIPADIPYLSVDPAPKECWRRELSNDAGLRIGIVWQGNPKFSRPDGRAADQRRSIRLSQFEPLASLAGARLYSLQKGYGTEQLAAWQTPFGIIDLGDRLIDLMDTAAVMMNLDLIISSDTSPLHLAGALGRPVWAVLPFSGCWRWLQDREDSPWYPTMRLFRQHRPGDWEEVFERIALEIRRLLV